MKVAKRTDSVNGLVNHSTTTTKIKLFRSIGGQPAGAVGVVEGKAG